MQPSGANTPAAARRRPRGLVLEIVGTLEAEIRAGQLPVGNKLPTEAEIMHRFDVSRTVVREALSRLQASGLVETRHGIGTFVSPPEPASPWSSAWPMGSPSSSSRIGATSNPSTRSIRDDESSSMDASPGSVAEGAHCPPLEFGAPDG